MQHTHDHVQSLREKSAQSYDDVHLLQVGLADTNINLDKISKELGRVGQATQELQATDVTLKEKLTVLEEARKMGDVRYEVIVKDVLAAKASDRKLQDSVERHINEDLRVLRKEIANTNLAVNQVVVEHQATANAGRENRDALRETRVEVERVLNEVKKSNTVTNILENRLASTAKGLQQSWGKCAELSDSMVQLVECYDRTKARVMEDEGLIREVTAFAKHTRGDVDQVVRQVEQNVDRLTQAMKLLGEESSATEDMRHQINAVRQSNSTALRQCSQLKSEVYEVKQEAATMKGAMKETSAMLLPNIHMDSVESVNTSARYGSMMTSSTMSGMSAGSSPGRPVSQKTARSPGGRPVSQETARDKSMSQSLKAWS
jgi:hypothetical protein